ncbi:hypothetical protein [uncultured Brachyspira sp.]|uniref:hypothetical protein n=1 Tax=uncultured Brachyspira sp. TaxID=221953 RepID=UPI002621B37F|nr:hypothetical protein [uncultured Brachyspira sp.]
MNKKILYEIYRLQGLQSIIYLCNNNPKLWEQYKAFAYALNCRIYPSLDIDNYSIFDEFDDDVYTGCGRDDSNYFFEYFYKYDLDNNLDSLTFYKIENDLGGKAKRYRIIFYLKYLQLHGKLPELYPHLNDDAPVEAKYLEENTNFNITDIRLFDI